MSRLPNTAAKRRRAALDAYANTCGAIQHDRTSLTGRPIERRCELPKGHAEAHLSASGIRWPITPIPSTEG